jgi:acetyl-CoA carboxylase carboxyltransferase component
MFITGPQVIKAVTGEEVSPEELGGAATHNRISGVAHYMAADEDECFPAGTYITVLPSQQQSGSPLCGTLRNTRSSNASGHDLREIVPLESNRAYDMRDVITRVVDDGLFFEAQEHYATNIITGFARLNGYSIGIIANQPRVLAGCLDINASDKAARFIRFCDAFNIPVVTFVDVPGFLPRYQPRVRWYHSSWRKDAVCLF